MANNKYKRGIVIDTSKYTIECEIDYLPVRVQDLYYKCSDGELRCAAYIFPIENREKVTLLLNELKVAKKTYDDKVAEVYYKIFPTLR